jgi:hypothetical protein
MIVKGVTARAYLAFRRAECLRVGIVEACSARSVIAGAIVGAGFGAVAGGRVAVAVVAASVFRSDTYPPVAVVVMGGDGKK